MYCFKRFYLFIFRERGREGERKGEEYQCVGASRIPPTGDLVCNPGMCPDWELNQLPFGLHPVLNPLSHTSQGQNKILTIFKNATTPNSVLPVVGFCGQIRWPIFVFNQICIRMLNKCPCYNKISTSLITDIKSL